MWPGPGSDTHSVDEAVVAVLLRVQHAIFDEHWDRPQDERHEKVHVDEVASAVQLPVHTNTHQYCCVVKNSIPFLLHILNIYFNFLIFKI